MPISYSGELLYTEYEIKIIILEVLDSIKKEHNYTCYCDEIIKEIKKRLDIE